MKKRSQSADLTFRELKIYYAEKGHHLADQSFETNLNLRNADGEYNLLAELLANRNNTPFLFVKFQGMDKSAISERNDYGYGCLLTTYMKVKDRLKAKNICISDTSVRPRCDRYLFDFDSVNEAVLNALGSQPRKHYSSSASFVPQLLKYAIFHLKTYHFDALLHLFYIAALLVYPKCTQSHFLDVSILSKMIIFRWFFIRVAAYPTMVFSHKHHSSYLLDVALSQ